MMCNVAFTKQYDIVYVSSIIESTLALISIECMSKIGQPHQYVYTFKVTGIING